MILAALLLAITPQAAAQSLDINVAELDQRMIELNGRIVRVRGWVSARCGRIGCALRARPSPRDGSTGPTTASISIGYDAGFEPTLQSVIGAEIVVEAVVDVTCRGDFICLDRVPELRPRRIVRVVSRAPTPAVD